MQVLSVNKTAWGRNQMDANDVLREVAVPEMEALGTAKIRILEKVMCIWQRRAL